MEAVKACEVVSALRARLHVTYVQSVACVWEVECALRARLHTTPRGVASVERTCEVVSALRARLHVTCVRSVTRAWEVMSASRARLHASALAYNVKGRREGVSAWRAHLPLQQVSIAVRTQLIPLGAS